MKISIGILTHNEVDYIKKLFPLLQKYIRESQSNAEYEVVVIDDFSDNLELINYFKEIEVDKNICWKIITHKLDNNFSRQKNFLSDNCSGDWILNIDADETISQELFDLIPEIIVNNPFVEAYRFPRVNIVEGLTQEHIDKYGWWVENVEGLDVICWPDWQTRLYKNTPSIRWKNIVHEVLDGHAVITSFPAKVKYAILHYKTIDRQVKQNEKYEVLMRNK